MISRRGIRCCLDWHRKAGMRWRLLLFVSWACTGGEAPSDQPVRTDSAGVALVLNTQDDRFLDWSFERVLDLGGTDSGPTAFFRVFPTSIGVDSLGNIYVLDAGNFTVAVFDHAGHHLNSFGREGEGPGEFGFPSDMAVRPDGQTAIYDFARRALLFFDPNGSWAGTLPLPGPLQRKVALLDHGRIAADVTQAAEVPDSTDYLLLVLGSDTADLGRVRQVSSPRPQQFSCTSHAKPRYFSPRVVWAAAGSRVAFSDDTSYSIHLFGESGWSAIWRRELPVVKSTLQLAAWEVNHGDSLRVRGCAIPAEEAARKFGYADLAPTIENLAVTPDGGIWLRRRTDEPGKLPIDILDHTGAYRGTLAGDWPFPAVFRGPDEFVTVETDDYDVPHVVVYRVHRGL